MQFKLNEKLLALQEEARRISKEQIAPGAAARDKAKEFPTDLLKICGEKGWMGCLVPEEFGGSDLVNFEKVKTWLGDRSSVGGTPHSQRSLARVRVVLEPDAQSFPIEQIIQETEAALGTPVQAAVKRADESEFARLNATNLMFCEDACRRIRARIELLEGLLDYRIESSHLESLHPHDAVAVVTRGVPGGLQP